MKNGPARWLLTARPLRLAFHKMERWLPLAVTNYFKYSLSEWSYAGTEWPRQDSAEEGWSAASVANAQESHWPIVVKNLAGTGPLGVSHLPSQMTRQDRGDHNAMMSYGYVLSRAARNRDRLSVLDWGGGLGHYYLYSQALLPEVVIDYHCFDVPPMCAAGRKVLPDATFHEQAATLEERRFDLVISSSSLHYFRDWREIARSLAAYSQNFLYVGRLQTVQRAPSFVVRQTPYGQGYDTEFLSWFINCEELIDCFEELGMELVREFVYSEQWKVKRAPAQGDCRGFLFRRRE